MATVTTQTSNHPFDNALSRRFSLNWETVVFIVILILAIFTRFYLLGERVMSHDESLHTQFSFYLYRDGNFSHTPLMHGPILFHATAFFYFLFGDNDFTSRIYPALLGVMVVMFPYLYRRWLGRWGAILASILLLISPLMMYYNRYIRHDTPSILFAMIMVYCILMYINGPPHLQGKGRWLYIFAAAMILNLGSKETSFIYIAVFWLFLLVFWLSRLAQTYLDASGKTIFEFAIMGFLFAGILALGFYIILEVVPLRILPNTGTPFGNLTPTQQQSLILWSIMAIGSVVALVVAPLIWVYRNRPQNLPWREVIIVLSIVFVVFLGLLIVEERSHTQEPVSTTPVAIDPNAPAEETDNTLGTTISWTPMIGLWLLTIIAFGVLFYTYRTSFWQTMRHFPEFDFLILVGTLILPWATAFIPYSMNVSPSDAANIANSLPAFINTFLSNVPSVGTPEQIGNVYLGFLAWLPLMALAIAIGLVWNWKDWLIASSIFHFIFAFFFTTVFTNIAGLASGMVYSLGYWLEQQGVRRGSQPQYYYLLLIMPFYEFLPIIGGILATFSGTIIFWRKRQRAEMLKIEAQELQAQLYTDSEEEEQEDRQKSKEEEIEIDILLEKIDKNRTERRKLSQLTEVPFLLFVSWWAMWNLIAYTLAGEKMPWLGTHMTTPLILLTAWYFGRIFQRIDWQILKKRGWLFLILLPLFFITVGRVFYPLLVGQRPFAGLQQHQLNYTYSWLGAVGISGALIYILYRVMETTGWAHLRRMIAVSILLVLSVITFRSAWIASMINYDYANEFLVYAHAAPAIKTVLDDIEELSLRTTDGLELRFAYDDLVPWPYSWYFRDYTNAVYVGNNPTLQALDNTAVVVVGEGNRSKVEPLLEDRYYRYDHMRLWWPMQDYFGLTAERVTDLFDFSPSNESAAQRRQGIFDIWWWRNYDTYGNATGKNFNATNWPVADKMYVYVRKDFASQIWSYGVGEGTVQNPLDSLPINQCNANWKTSEAVAVLEAIPFPLNRPVGIAAHDNRVYVSEEYGHRISIFDTDGTYIDSFGKEPDQQGIIGIFNRPNSIDISTDGRIFVADTWNFQIKQVDEEGQVLASWGQAGEYGFDAPVEPVDGFWGPRDVVVSDDGRVFVADTGNKRIRVYQQNGNTVNHLYDIGSAGSQPGQLDEPSGLAIHPDGRLFVADTWNRRISVFSFDGVFLETYQIRGWYDDLGFRPYLAVDPERNYLYVSDPNAGRVLVLDVNGDCLGAFGQPAGDTFDNTQFKATGGIAVDDEGFVYVVDSELGRVLKFEPFERPFPIVPVEQLPQSDNELSENQDTDNGNINQAPPDNGQANDANTDNLDSGVSDALEPEATEEVEEIAE